MINERTECQEEWYHETELFRTHRIFRKIECISDVAKSSSSTIFYGPFKSFWDAREHAMVWHQHVAAQSKCAYQEVRSMTLEKERKKA